MAQRKPLSKKIRFEVFKRDKFTCQYCGKSAPDVVLHVDHIKPVSKGGTNDIMNLITSCQDCNLGKGAKELSDDSTLKKQQAQIKELAERKEQLEMMLDWRNRMLDLKDDEVEKIKEYWHKKADMQYEINEHGEKSVRKWLKDFSIIEILDAIDIAFDQYYDTSKESVEHTFKKVSGICYNRKNGQTDQSKWFNYLKNACKNKYGDIGNAKTLRLRSVCYNGMASNDDFETAKSLLTKSRNLYMFIDYMEEEFS